MIKKIGSNKGFKILLTLTLIQTIIWAPKAFAQEPNSEIHNLSEQIVVPNITVVTGGVDAFNSGYKAENLKGPRTTVVKQFLDQKGISYTIDPMYWGRAYNIANTQKNTLIYPLTRNTERENEFHWIKEVDPQKYHLVGLSSINPNTLTPDQITGGDYYAICEVRSTSCIALREFGFQEKNIIRHAGLEFAEITRILIEGRPTFMAEDWEEIILPVIGKNPKFKGKVEKIKGFEKIQHNYLAGKNLSPEILKILTQNN